MDRPTPAAEVGAEATRSEEELVVVPRRRVIERIRLRRVIVTEEVLLKVAVRREELHVERVREDGPVPADAVIDVDDADGIRYRMVLHDEVPEVVMRVVPRESVQVVVTTHLAHTDIRTDLRHEEVEADLPEGRDHPDASTPRTSRPDTQEQSDDRS